MRAAAWRWFPLLVPHHVRDRRAALPPDLLRRAIVAEGWNAVVWSAEKDEFPYLKGMSSIVSGG